MNILMAHYVEENKLAPMIGAELDHQGLTQMITDVSDQYGNPKKDLRQMLIAGIALELVYQHAKQKRTSDPADLFLPAKLADTVQALLANLASSTSHSKAIPTPVAKGRMIKIRYGNQLNWNGKLFSRHPITKALGNRDEIRNIPATELIQHATGLMIAQGIQFDAKDVADAFAQKGYYTSIPVPSSLPGVATMVEYQRHSGELVTTKYDMTESALVDYPAYTRGLITKVLGELQEVLDGLPNLQNPENVRIHVANFRNGPYIPAGKQRTTVGIMVDVTGLNNNLDMATETIGLHTTLELAKREIDSYPDHAEALENAWLTLRDEFFKPLINRDGIYKTRNRKNKNLGGASIEIDRATQMVLDKIREIEPEVVDKIIAGKAKAFITTENHPFFFKAARHKGKDATRVNFTINNGRLQCSMRLDKEIYWQKNQLMVPTLPVLLAESLVGQPATAVFDHPFVEVLGEVRTAANRHRVTVISFKNYCDAVMRPGRGPKEGELLAA